MIMTVININLNSLIREYGSIFVVTFFFIIGVLVHSILMKRKYANMKQSLYYREELFRILCPNIDDIFIIYHFGKQIMEYVSPNLERIFGINVTNFKKNPCLFFNNIAPAFQEKIEELFTVRITTSVYETEFNYINPQNKCILPVMMRIYPIIKNREVIRYVISVSDQMKKKQSQQVLTDALVYAQNANEAKKDFLSHVSHEIKTPINAIISMVKIAGDSLEDKDKTGYYLRLINDSSRNLLKFVDDVLTMARMDRNKIVLSKEPFQLNEFLSGYGYTINPQAEIKRLAFGLSMDLEHVHLLGDTMRLRQILDNCISNALKFSPSGGNIKLMVSEIGKYGKIALYRFVISDNGKGMSEECLSRIFIPFEQEDSTTADTYGGSGLGMPIAKNLVTLMEGDIHVSSKLNFGTTVTIYLPFDIADEQKMS